MTKRQIIACCVGVLSLRGGYFAAGDPSPMPSFQLLQTGDRVEIEYLNRGHRGRLEFTLLITGDGDRSAWLQDVKHKNWIHAEELTAGERIPLSPSDLAHLDERMAKYRNPQTIGCSQTETIRVRWLSGSKVKHKEKFVDTCARYDASGLLTVLDLANRARHR